MRNWTICEVQYLIDNKHLSNARLAAALGRSAHSVESITCELKLRWTRERRPKPRKKRRFTPQAKAMLFRETAIC
jgi:hypothetical protein